MVRGFATVKQRNLERYRAELATAPADLHVHRTVTSPGANHEPSPRVAVVTGAGAGIGRAYAERLAADGLVVAAVDLAAPDDTVAAIAKAGGTAAGFTADVTDPARSTTASCRSARPPARRPSW